jgi:hypothetical protein
MYAYAKKLLNQKNCIMKKKMTEVCSRNKEAVARKRSNLNESEEGQPGQLFTMSAGSRSRTLNQN